MMQKIEDPERQQRENNVLAISLGPTNEKHECNKSYILQKKSLSCTQSGTAASKLVSWSVCDANLGE